LAGYLEKRYQFRQRVAQLRDRRQRPQIPTANIWLSVCGMFLLRLGSFNALEQELRRSKRWESWVGCLKPSADTIGRVCSQMSLTDARQLLVELNRCSWRSKAIHLQPGESYRVVAIDGHELSASRARCCARCSQREIKVGGKTVLEYYHRVVVAQWVGVSPPSLLDLELIDPQEGEVVAARRLLVRIVAHYPRLIDVLTADALYLEAPFIQLALNAGKHVVIVMKQENRELFQDADQLRALTEPRVLHNGPRTTRLWDISQLSSFSTLGLAVRVVWAEESTVTRKLVGGKPQEELGQSRWVWVTDLPAASVPAGKIQKWGHARWDLENRGFNELVNLWHMDHCFIHDTNAMETLLLILAMAFLVSYLFYERNLKPEARRYLTRLALARRFIEDFSALDGATLWASLQPG
jgi:hypothetical protein